MADHLSDTISLDWPSAEVHDHELRVALQGEPHKGWRQHFKTTVKLLGSGQWGELTLKKSHLRVADVTPGSEQDLRHHLEAVVAQANAAVAADEERDRGSAEPGDRAPAEPGPAAENEEDARMTAQFRGFADGGRSDGEADEG